MLKQQQQPYTQDVMRACSTLILFKWLKRKWASAAQRMLMLDELAGKTTQCPSQEGIKNKGS